MALQRFSVMDDSAEGDSVEEDQIVGDFRRLRIRTTALQLLPKHDRYNGFRLQPNRRN